MTVRIKSLGRSLYILVLECRSCKYVSNSLVSFKLYKNNIILEQLRTLL